MFIVTDKQLKLMQEANVRDFVVDTCAMIKDEFPELLLEQEEELHKLVLQQTDIAHKKFLFTSFDAIQDYLILYLQNPILQEQPLRKDVLDLLTWKGMPDENKVSEIRKILKRQ